VAGCRRRRPLSVGRGRRLCVWCFDLTRVCTGIIVSPPAFTGAATWSDHALVRAEVVREAKRHAPGSLGMAFFFCLFKKSCLDAPGKCVLILGRRRGCYVGWTTRLWWVTCRFLSATPGHTAIDPPPGVVFDILFIERGATPGCAGKPTGVAFSLSR